MPGKKERVLTENGQNANLSPLRVGIGACLSAKTWWNSGGLPGIRICGEKVLKPFSIVGGRAENGSHSNSGRNKGAEAVLVATGKSIRTFEVGRRASGQ